MTKLLKPLMFVAAAAVLGGCATKGPERMAAVEKLTLAVVPGDPSAVRITATGSVPTAGWSGALLRPVNDPTFPPGVVAFELVAIPPKRGTVVALGARRMTTAAIAQLPPGTQRVNVLAAVNDETADVPGVRVKRVRVQTNRYRQVFVRAGGE